MQGIGVNSASYLTPTYGQSTRTSSPPAEQSVSGSIFQNLLKSGYVDDCVSQSDDGTYSFDLSRPDSTSPQALLARQIILNQTSDGADHWHLTPGDLDIFKQMTGYNFVITEGAATVADDQGNPPPAAAKSAIDAAWRFMDHVAIARMNGNLTGEVTPEWSRKLLSDLQDMGRLGYLKGAWVPSDGFIDKLLDVVTAKSAQSTTGNP